MKNILLLILIILCYSTGLYAQDSSFVVIEKKLNELAKTYPALNEKVDISVSEVSIQEFIRSVAKNSKVNINVSPDLNFSVINNFSEVRVVDMLIFLAKEYDLDVSITGNIISISKKKQAPPPPIVIKEKELKISFNNKDSTLSLDLHNDTLYDVAKAITLKSGMNVVLSPGIERQLVTAYIQNKPFYNVLEMFAFANNLMLTKDEKGFYRIEQKEKSTANKNNKSNKTNRDSKKSKANSKSKNNEETFLDINILDYSNITIHAVNAPIEDIIKQISDELNINYYIISDIKGEANLNVTNISYEKLIDNLFDGTDAIFHKQKGIYLFGERKAQELRKTVVYQLQYRSVENVLEVIPESLKKDLDLSEFLDLNSIIISGAITQVEDLENFFKDIDKVVPVILIEVMIVNVSESHTTSVGINAGLNSSNVPVKTQGTFAPGIDLTLSTSTINNLINSFNGFGWFNIGKVTPEFYLSIQALEENGFIKLESTPMLSTINGTEAELSIGETTYYYEEKQSVIGTQNPQNINTKTWKSLKADLKIKIKPIVSGDEQVTLEIEVSQSDFSGKVSKDAPPNTVDRSFKSSIRVKNQEMILLGGLKNKKKSDTGKGVPLLSRIPGLRWLFSSRTKEDSKDKLTIFIKPTVIY